MKKLVRAALLACLTVAVTLVGCEARSSGESHVVVRTWRDGRGQTVTLYAGRGRGGRGDWGWLHIKGKHIDGIWHDGGRITTFPQAVGARTDEAVQGLIGQALQQPPTQEHGRSLYHYTVTGSGYEILVVVASDGTVITAYPERPTR